MAYFPNVETAERIKRFVRAGIRDEKRLAKMVNITQKQLVEYYQYELEYTDDEELAVVADVAYEMAISGQFPHMTQWWLKQKGPKIWHDKAPPQAALGMAPITVLISNEEARPLEHILPIELPSSEYQEVKPDDDPS